MRHSYEHNNLYNKMKNSIYELAERLVSRGYSFHVNLEARNLMINGKYVIKNGVWNEKRALHNIVLDEGESIFDRLGYLYELYFFSRPTERSCSSGKKYFKALPEKDLSDEDMMYAPVRDLAQLRLELAVLCFVLDSSLSWSDTFGNWFWQSTRNKNFVILRKWIDNQ